MGSVSWLHISDLHILRNDPTWETYKGCLLGKLEKDFRRPDFVVVTGDYRNIRSNEPFDKAEMFMRELMELLDLDLARDLFVVPGNHDLRPRQKVEKPKRGGKNFFPWIRSTDADPRTHELQKLLPDGLHPWISKDESETWLAKHEKDPKNYIDRLCGIRRNNEEDGNIVFFDSLHWGFEEYGDLATRLVTWYSDANVNPAVSHCRKWEDGNGMGLNLVHLNTAIVADGSRCHYQALDLSGATKTLLSIKNGLPTLIIAHNNYYDLHPQIRENLKQGLLSANTCAWLCGDQHRFNEKEEIIVSKGKSIPILVCGKGAPDNRDTYSENGFIFYEWDGQEIAAKYFKWSMIESEDLDPVRQKSIPANFEVLASAGGSNQTLSETKTRKQLFIGYLSCNPGVPFEKKYHLGHAYFIYTIEKKLSDNDYVVLLTSSYVLRNNRDINSIQADTQYANDMCQLWDSCFKGRIKVVDIRDYLQTNTPDETNDKKSLLYVTTMEMKLCNDTKCIQIIDRWHQTGTIEENEYHYIMDVFEVGHQNTYEKEEIMSFAYLLYKRPMWYSSAWLVNFIHFWNAQLYDLIRDELKINVDMSDVFIAEAKRNHYVWDAISYLCRRFSYVNLPKVSYFENLLDLDCNRPMKSSNTARTVFLADYNNGEIFFSEQFKAHIREMFNTAEKPGVIAEKYYKKLFLSQ